MHPYRIDVSDILPEIGVSSAVDGEYPLDRLVVGDEIFESRSPVRVSGDITNAGEGLVARLDVVAPVVATCARCLRDFDLDIEAHVDTLYLDPGDIASEDEDVETVDAEGYVDLAPAIMSALVLEAPFAPLHDEDCPGLCAECGADLNTGPCACDRGVDEAHPFAGLRVLLDDEDAGVAE